MLKLYVLIKSSGLEYGPGDFAVRERTVFYVIIKSVYIGK